DGGALRARPHAARGPPQRREHPGSGDGGAPGRRAARGRAGGDRRDRAAAPPARARRRARRGGVVRRLEGHQRGRGGEEPRCVRGSGTGALGRGAAAPPAFRGALGGQRPRLRGALGGDPWLVLAVAALVGLSVVMVFNVSYFYGQDHFGDSLLFFRKHLLAIGLGTVVAVVASRLSSDTYRRASYPLLIVLL